MSMKYVRIYMRLAHCPPVEKIFWSYRHGYMPSLWYWYSVRQPFFSVYHSTIRYSFSPKNLNLLCQWVSMPVIPFFPFSSFVTGLICLFPLKLGRKKLKLNHISLYLLINAMVMRNLLVVTIKVWKHWVHWLKLKIIMTSWIPINFYKIMTIFISNSKTFHAQVGLPRWSPLHPFFY